MFVLAPPGVFLPVFVSPEYRLRPWCLFPACDAFTQQPQECLFAHTVPSYRLSPLVLTFTA